MLDILIPSGFTLICCGVTALYIRHKAKELKDMVLDESAKHDLRNRRDFGTVLGKTEEVRVLSATVMDQQVHMLEKLDDALDTAAAADPRELVAQGISAMMAYTGQPRKRGD